MVLERRGDGGRVSGCEVVEAAQLTGGGPSDAVDEVGEALGARGVVEGFYDRVSASRAVSDPVHDGAVTVGNSLDRCHVAPPCLILRMSCLVLIVLRLISVCVTHACHAAPTPPLYRRIARFSLWRCGDFVPASSWWTAVGVPILVMPCGWVGAAIARSMVFGRER